MHACRLNTAQNPRLIAPFHVCMAMLAATLMASVPASAQSSSEGLTAWRATSRLGYGPSPATTQAAQSDPKSWALQQIDTAYAASRQAPHIPADLARFNEPVNDIVRDFHAEREARRVARAPAVSASSGMATMATAQAALPAETGFSREMQQTAAAWRVMACSDPDMENPLLARMTEFWFNHLRMWPEITSRAQPLAGTAR